QSPEISCDGIDTYSAGVWYKLVGTGGEVILDLCAQNGLNTDFSTEVTYWTGDCSTGLSCFSGYTNELCSFEQNLTATLTTVLNEEYLINITGRNNEAGNVELAVSELSPPVNDICNSAIALTINDCNSTIYTNTDASYSNNLPGFNCYNGDTDVWFTVVMPTSGIIDIATSDGDQNSISDSAFDVYTGSCGNLSFYDCGSSNPPPIHHLLTINDAALAGQTLYIRVSDQGELGTFNICVTSPCTPPTFDYTLTLDCANNTYSIDVNVESLGDAAAADLIYTGGSTLNVMANTSYNIGSFPLENLIDITLVDQTNAECFSERIGVTGSCTIPANDDVCNAIDLTSTISTSFPITFSTYTNLGATVQANEVRPKNIDGNCETYDDWCDGTVGGAAGLEHSVWFSFIAPAGGFISVSTQLMNTQLAIWEASSCGDLLTTNALMVTANDDLFAGNTSAEVYLQCLIPGQQYYIQVDGYQSAQGDFEIGILHDSNAPPCGILTNTSGQDVSCSTYSIKPPPSEGYGDWIDIYGDLDRSFGLICSINDKGQVLGDITVDMMINGDGIRFDNNLAYLDRNWSISTQHTFSEPICLRFYFSEAELTALGAVDNFVDNVNKLGFSKWSSASCGDYPTTGTLDQLYATKAGLLTTGVYYIDVEVEDLSAFYLHSNAGILPLELINFSAFANDKQNQIYWTTATERNISHFELQRSLDGKNDWTTIEKVVAAGFSYENQRYQVIDNQLFSNLFYRLKIVELSGEIDFSKIIQVQQSDNHTLQIVPNPTRNQISIRGVNAIEEAAEITIYDVFGKIQLRQEMPIKQQISVQHLTAGTYWVQLKTPTQVYAQKLLIQK
ncbi:MAG: T9SS type A sorting domain-containing protein, partial [Saprospiraceae bacterium]